MANRGLDAAIVAPPPLSPAERRALTSPSLDAVRFEIQAMDRHFKANPRPGLGSPVLRVANSNHRAQHRPTSATSSQHRRPYSPSFVMLSAAEGQGREEPLWVQPTSGGYARPASASSLRNSPSVQSLRQPVHRQFPTHQKHLEELQAAGQWHLADGAPEYDQDNEDMEEEAVEEAEEEYPTALDGWHPSSPPRSRPSSAARQRHPQHKHYHAQNQQTVAHPPPSMARPPPPTLHMPRPSAAVVHTAAAGMVLSRPTSAATRKTLALSRPSSAASRLSFSFEQHSHQPRQPRALRRSNSAAQVQLGASQAFLTASRAHGITDSTQRFNKSPSGWDIGQAYENLAEVENVRGLPRVTRRRVGPDFDLAGNLAFENMSEAAKAGRTFAPRGQARGPTTRPPWECIIARPGTKGHSLEDHDEHSPRGVVEAHAGKESARIFAGRLFVQTPE